MLSLINLKDHNLWTFRHIYFLAFLTCHQSRVLLRNDVFMTVCSATFNLQNVAPFFLCQHCFFHGRSKTFNLVCPMYIFLQFTQEISYIGHLIDWFLGQTRPTSKRIFSRLVGLYSDALSSLEKVILFWIPGHSNIMENKQVNGLAMRGQWAQSMSHWWLSSGIYSYYLKAPNSEIYHLPQVNEDLALLKEDPIASTFGRDVCRCI